MNGTFIQLTLFRISEICFQYGKFNIILKLQSRYLLFKGFLQNNLDHFLVSSVQ